METCARCGRERKLIAGTHCNACRVRLRYEAGTPVPCQRCERVLLPFARGMCKSCYQVMRKQPDATRRGTPEHSQRMSDAQQHSPNRREKSGKWKGGRFVDSEGYVRILPPDDYEGRRVHGGRYVHEHRYVAEQMIGRPLARGEVVHHINHDRADNRPENLQVLASISEHRRLHAEEWRHEHA